MDKEIREMIEHSLEGLWYPTDTVIHPPDPLVRALEEMETQDYIFLMVGLSNKLN